MTDKVFSTSIKLFKEYLNTLDEEKLIKRFVKTDDSGVDTQKMLKTIGRYVIHDCSHICKNKSHKLRNMNWVNYCAQFWLSFYLECDTDTKSLICQIYFKMILDRRMELNPSFNPKC
jgi:hypothetical protein